MRRWQDRVRGFILLSAVPFAAACDDGPTRPDRLAPEVVAERYRVCTLAFTPTSRFLPVVDVHAEGIRTEGGVTLPNLALDPTGTFELEYTPTGRFTDVEHRGTFTTGESTVVLSFTTPADVAPLLLPAKVEAGFVAGAEGGGKALVVESSPPYTVAKADYERLLGESDPGIPAQVEGRLTGRFATVACE